jgi:hypothetical protein
MCAGSLTCTGQSASWCGNIKGCQLVNRIFQTTAGYYGIGINFTPNVSQQANYLLVGNKPALDLGWNFSILFWMKSNASNSGAIISRVYPSYYKGYMITANVKKMRGSAYNGGIGQQGDLDTTGNVFDGNWHHLAFIHNMTHLIWYVDGLFNTSMIWNKTAYGTNGYNAYIGWRYDTTAGYMNGTISDLFVFNRTLSLTEIQDIKNGNYGYSVTNTCSYIGSGNWLLNNVACQWTVTINLKRNNVTINASNITGFRWLSNYSFGRADYSRLWG